MLPEDLPVLCVCLSVSLSIYFSLNVFRREGSPCPPRSQAPELGQRSVRDSGGSSRVPSSLPSFAGAARCGFPAPARPETRTVCVCPCPCVCVRVQGLGCAPLGSEPAPAGDGLNVLFPVLTSAIKRSIPASPNHFLNPTGVFTGGKESRSAPRNASVGVFYLFKIFLLLFFMVA